MCFPESHKRSKGIPLAVSFGILVYSQDWWGPKEFIPASKCCKTTVICNPEGLIKRVPTYRTGLTIMLLQWCSASLNNLFVSACTALVVSGSLGPARCCTFSCTIWFQTAWVKMSHLTSLWCQIIDSTLPMPNCPFWPMKGGSSSPPLFPKLHNAFSLHGWELLWVPCSRMNGFFRFQSIALDCK